MGSTEVSNLNPAVGIDLGTTNTVVAVKGSKYDLKILEIAQPTTERNRLDSELLLKSCVFMENDESAIVGRFASERRDAIRSVKSHMGTRTRFKPPGVKRSLTPSVVSSFILTAVYDRIRSLYPGWDGQAAIGVPASFNSEQRRDTIRAAKLAGFSEHIQLIDEPMAAFYYYLEENPDLFDESTSLSVLIFDFGGGTLDVSIVDIKGDGGKVELDPIGRSRYTNLGGDDIDVDMAVFFLACWEFENSTNMESYSLPLQKEIWRLFLGKASLFKEEVEESLASGHPYGEFSVRELIILGDGQELEVDFSREVPEDLYREFSGRYFSGTSEINVFRPIEQAISLAQRIRPGFQREDLGLLLYTGGASRMSTLTECLKREFGSRTCLPISNPDQACNTVALGAASYRYEEMLECRHIYKKDRLLESILTRDDTTGDYFELVPSEAVPTDDFVPVPIEFRTQRRVIKLQVPLFRGTGPRDHQLVPMAPLEFELDSIVREDTKYAISYRVGGNLTVEFKAVFYPTGGTAIEENAQIALDVEARSKVDCSQPVSVNVV